MGGVTVLGLIAKSRRPARGKRGEPGRFVTLRSGRKIFIPEGYKSKWADVRDKIKARKKGETYTVDTEYSLLTVHKVPRGGEMPRGVSGDRPQVIYNVEDKTWHFASGDIEERHADWAQGALGRAPVGYEPDTLMVNGFFNRETGQVELYSDSAKILENTISDPLKARRTANLARRALGMAKVNVFTVGGKAVSVKEIETPVWEPEEEEWW